MRQDLFEARYSDDWTAFESWLNTQAGARTQNDATALATQLVTSDVPRSYRQISRHLALARDRQYGAQLVARLEAIVLAGHQAIYGAHAVAAGGGAGQFIRATFPQLVRAHWPSVLVATLCFIGSLIGITIIIQFFPDFAYVLISPEQLAQMQQMYDPANHRLGTRGAESDAVMWGYYIWNNVRIDFQCFAGGILFGVGSLFFLVFNGIQIGAVAGHLTHIGYIETFWGFVAGHSGLELLGAVLSGAAGLQLGHALIAPGRATRLEALKAAIPDAIRIVYGAAAMTFMAAFIEAFWSSSRALPVTVKYAVGITLWVLLIAYFVFAGRNLRQPAQVKHEVQRAS